MSGLHGWRATVVPVTSFTRIVQATQPVFVPECGGRWGKPSRLSMAVDDGSATTEEKPDPTVVVNDYITTITRVGTEIDVGSEVKNAKTGAIEVEGRVFVCSAGKQTFKTQESRTSGTATIKHFKYTTNHYYVDCKPWIKYMSNFDSWETNDILACCPEDGGT